MSDLPQFRDAIAAATETLGSLSSLEDRMAEAADLIEQCLRADDAPDVRRENAIFAAFHLSVDTIQ